MKTAREWLLEQLKEFPNHDEYDPKAVDAIADFMEHYAKYYHEQQVKKCDLADVVGRSEQLVCPNCADWFLLSEKKPDSQQEIIFFSDDVYVGVWWDNSDTVNGNMPGCYDDNIDKKDITHWMPFPQKPICA